MCYASNNLGNDQETITVDDSSSFFAGNGNNANTQLQKDGNWIIRPSANFQMINCEISVLLNIFIKILRYYDYEG